MGRRSKAKPRKDPLTKLARTILPDAQVERGGLVMRDIANHSDSDQRRMVRSGETKTVRKLTRVELLTRAGIITSDQASACEWYAEAHELGYGTVGCTANYGGAGGGGFGSSDLLARYRAQQEARENFSYARLAIPAHLVGLFDRVVIGPMDIRTLTKDDRLAFGLAAYLLHGQIGHLLAIAA
jgi:hypothetical protein